MPSTALWRYLLRPTVILAVGLLLGACSSLRYYAHVAHGQAMLVLHRRPIDRVLRDPATDPKLARRLARAQRARRFASRQLDLPDNRSYTGYVALPRPYVAWNVFATPRFSVDAVPQCFPIAGCVAYRGYFDLSLARDAAAKLRARGDDVWIGPVPAYSTLGWFADPILSSMLGWDDDQLAATIFHELAHQRIYVKGDTAFNESYASFVEREGLREWRAARGLPTTDRPSQAVDDGFTDLVLALRKRLARLYAVPADATTMAAAKTAAIEDFRRHYRTWRDANWPNDHRYDAWVAAPINNAQMLPFGLYDRWVPAFTVLFQRAERSWPAFYAQVRQLGNEPAARRDAALRVLLGEAAAAR